jgi:hypothetical protein
MLENGDDVNDAHPPVDDGVNCSMRLMREDTRVGRDGDDDNAPAPPPPTAAGDE